MLALQAVAVYRPADTRHDRFDIAAIDEAAQGPAMAPGPGEQAQAARLVRRIQPWAEVGELAEQVEKPREGVEDAVAQPLAAEDLAFERFRVLAQATFIETALDRRWQKPTIRRGCCARGRGYPVRSGARLDHGMKRRARVYTSMARPASSSSGAPRRSQSGTAGTTLGLCTGSSLA